MITHPTIAKPSAGSRRSLDAIRQRVFTFLRTHWYVSALVFTGLFAVARYLTQRDDIELVVYSTLLLWLALLPTLLLALKMRRINRRLNLRWVVPRVERNAEGKINHTTVTHYPSTGLKHKMQHGYLFDWTGFPTVTARDLMAKREQLTLDLHAYRCDIEELGTLEAKVTVWKSDPLKPPPSAEYLAPEPFDPTEGMYVGWDEQGRKMYLQLENRTGASVAGYPGSGKTILLRRIALEASLGGSRVIIANGKGDDAYSDLESLGITCIFDSKQEFLQLLTDLERLRRERMNEMPDNYIVTIIDELQEYLTVYTKEDKPAVEQIKALLVNLARKQRSSRMLTIFGSQKIDSTAIPTAFRDLFELRISGSTPSATVTKIALGELRDEDPQPHDPKVIPGGSHGRFIIKGQGKTKVFQASNLAENQVQDFVQARLRERSEQAASKGATTTPPIVMRDVGHDRSE